MNLKPLGDRIVVEPTEQEGQTSLGIFLPETAKEKPQQGKVIAAGPGGAEVFLLGVDSGAQPGQRVH